MSNNDIFLRNIANIDKFFPEEKTAKTKLKRLTTKQLNNCMGNLIRENKKRSEIDSTKEPIFIEKVYKKLNKIIQEIKPIEKDIKKRIIEHKTRILCTNEANENKIKKTKADIAFLEDHYQLILKTIKTLEKDKDIIIEKRELISPESLLEREIKRNTSIKKIRKYL